MPVNQLMPENGKHNPAVRIVLIYLLTGCAWILFSDNLITRITNKQILIGLSILKGWLFVGVTATLLYHFISKYFTQLEKSRLTLIDGQERLRMALRASRMGVWEWDFRTDLVIWSPEVHDIVGLKDFDGRFESFGRLLHPEDSDRVRAVVQQALARRGEYSDEFRIIRPDNGEVCWLANLGQGTYDLNGTPLAMLGTVQDITIQKAAQDALKASELRMKLVLQSVKVGIWDWNLKSGLAYLSPEYYEIAECRPEDVTPDMNFFMSLVHLDDRKFVSGVIDAHLTGNTPDSGAEFRMVTGRGAVKWVQGRGKVVERDLNGAPLRMLGTIIDITERKQAEVTLLEGEQLKRKTLDALQANIAVVKREGYIIAINKGWAEFAQANNAGGSPAVILGANYCDVCRKASAEGEEDAVQALAGIEGVLSGKLEQFTMEYPCHSPEKQRWFSMTVMPIDGHGDYGVVISHFNITERKHAEILLVELNEKLRILTDRIQTVQEQERISIARDIHDDIGQYLTALKLDISWIESRLDEAEGELAERMEGMKTSIDLLITRVQLIAAELRPPLLDNLGLAAAIGWQVNEFTRHSGIECIMMLNEDAEPDNQQTATSIVRIVQEALTNVIRHAGATEVVISLCKSNDSLLLEISDNGCGISQQNISAKESYGLTGMQERARICGGELTINGSPGIGTRLRLTIPFKERNIEK